MSVSTLCEDCEARRRVYGSKRCNPCREARVMKSRQKYNQTAKGKATGARASLAYYTRQVAALSANAPL